MVLPYVGEYALGIRRSHHAHRFARVRAERMRWLRTSKELNRG